MQPNKGCEKHVCMHIWINHYPSLFQAQTKCFKNFPPINLNVSLNLYIWPLMDAFGRLYKFIFRNEYIWKIVIFMQMYIAAYGRIYSKKSGTLYTVDATLYCRCLSATCILFMFGCCVSVCVLEGLKAHSLVFVLAQPLHLLF